MAVIKAFCSVRYNERLLAYAENLMTPPYDVISPEDQESYYDQNPFNVIRLLLGKQFPDDTNENNRYTRARDFLENWTRDGVLVPDDSPSIYGYSEVYRGPDGKTKRRDGFLALLELEEWGKKNVFPHEHTYAGPKADRLNLVRATGCQFSTIFSLYSDPKGETSRIVQSVISSPEVTRYKDRDGVEHILTRCGDAAVNEGLIAAMRDKKVFVADGHHRYETMLAYRDELEREGVPGDDHRYMAVYFTLMEGEAITILPCHRIIQTERPIEPKAVLPILSEVFSVQAFGNDKEGARRLIRALEEKGKGSFGFFPGGDRYFLLSDANRDKTARFFPAGMKDEIRQLDVSVLHDVLIRGLLSIVDPKIGYSQDAREALGRVVGGTSIAFLVNATKIEEVKAASLAGERMPQKSTYFYPKPASGLVFYRLIT
ncbi:MAG: DUF1015 domain-containing protein [Deltaproteobacteria bacterium]|nr:DUF1015 domain-containing protein [Candidatus Zymogenaceae bacterium]